MTVIRRTGKRHRRKSSPRSPTSVAFQQRPRNPAAVALRLACDVSIRHSTKKIRKSLEEVEEQDMYKNRRTADNSYDRDLVSSLIHPERSYDVSVVLGRSYPKIEKREKKQKKKEKKKQCTVETSKRLYVCPFTVTVS